MLMTTMDDLEEKNDKTCNSYEKIDLYIRSEYIVNCLSQNQWGEKLLTNFSVTC